MDMERSLLFIDVSTDLTAPLKKKFNFSTVKTGMEAITKLQHSPTYFSVIVMNLNLPDISNIEFIKKIQQDNSLKNIPIILLADKETESQLSWLVELEIFDILIQPFDTQLLNGVILRALKFYKQFEQIQETP